MKPKTLCLPALTALLATQARAVDVTSTWTGLSTVNNSWGSAANWNGGVLPSFGNNQIVVFTGTARLTNAIAQDRTIKSFAFDANADSAFFVRLRNGTADTEIGRILTFQSDTGVSTLSMEAGAAANHQIISGAVTGAGTAGRITLANPLNVVQDSTTNTLTLGDNPAIISGGAGATINKSGAGIFILGGANTFTDAVNINAGTLRIGSGGTLGTNAGGTFVANGATLDVAGVKITTSGENVSIIGSGVGGVGSLYSSTGNLSQSNIGVNLILTGDATVGVAGARNGITSGTISSGGMNYTLTKVGTGQFDTESSSVNVGEIIVNQGIFQTANAATFNTGFPVTVNGAEFRIFELVNPLARNFVLNGGTINNTGSVNFTGDTIAGNITLTGSGTINSGGGAGDSLTIAGNVGESAPGASLNIGGTQAIALPGTNTYTGNTNINSGALRASGTFTSNIAVSATGTLDGEGSTSGSLTLEGGSTIVFNPATTGANQYFRAASVTVNGLVTVRPSALASGSDIVVFQTTTGTLNLGDFSLDFGTLGELSLGAGGTQLLYTNAGANLEWRALVDNFWGEAEAANLQNLTTNTPATFVSGDNVNFVNLGTGTVEQFGNIVAGVVNFNNTTGNNFVIQPIGGETLTAISLNHTSTGDVTIGSGIAGTTPVNKTGTGKLVLSGANSSTGAITNSTGILQIGDGVQTTSSFASSAMTNNGTLDFNIAGNPTFNVITPISGTGNIVHSGSNFTELQGTNTYSGTTTVNAGIFRFSKPAALYNGNSADWTPSKLIANAGGGMGILIGPANFSTADFTTLLGNLVTGPVAGYKAGSTMVVNTNADSTIADNIPDSTGTGGGSIGFFKGGTAILTLTGTNTFTGGLSVNNGTLIGGDANFGNGTINMGLLGNTGGILQLTGSTDNPINFANTGTGTKVINLATGVTNATLSGTITLAADGAPGTNGLSRINTVTGTIVISGKMTGTGTGGYAKRNIGAVVITNATNDYTGPTTIVDAGTLLVDGKVSSANTYFGPNIDGTGTGAADGTLGGKGLIAGNVTTKGASNLSPGGTSAGGANTHTAETLTIGGTLDLTVSAAGTGKLIYQLGAPAASDKLVVGGLTIGSGALGYTDFTFTNSGGFAPGVYTLISSGTAISGALDPANLTGTINGMTSTLSISGNDVILTVVNPSTPFQSWMSTYYPSITSPNNDAAVDFDGDGISNFVEFAFGGAPDSGASTGPRRSAIDNIGGTDYITLTIATRTGTVFSGSAPATGSKDNVNYTVGGSLDLSAFTQPVTEVTPAITTGLPALGSGPLTDYEYHTFRFTAPRTANPQAFLRALAVP